MRKTVVLVAAAAVLVVGARFGSIFFGNQVAMVEASPASIIREDISPGGLPGVAGVPATAVPPPTQYSRPTVEWPTVATLLADLRDAGLPLSASKSMGVYGEQVHESSRWALLYPPGVTVTGDYDSLAEISLLFGEMDDETTNFVRMVMAALPDEMAREAMAKSTAILEDATDAQLDEHGSTEYLDSAGGWLKVRYNGARGHFTLQFLP